MTLRLTVLSLLLALIFTFPAAAQITITQANMPGFGSSQTSFSPNTQPALDVGSAGANRSWNVPEVAVSISGFTEIVTPAGTPFAANFPTATHCFTDGGDYYAYARIASNGFYMLGWATPSIMQVWDPESLEFPFPATYNTAWTSVSSWSYEIAGVTTTTTDSSISSIDGWGTMTNQFGSYQVLRVASHNFQIVAMTIPPLPPFVTTTVTYSYTWLTAEGLPVVTMMSNPDETDPNFTAGYLSLSISGAQAAEPVRGPLVDNFSVGQNYPNPFNPTTSLPISLAQSASVEITIYNQLGEVVSSQEYQFGPGQHTVGFDGSAWASGNYFAQVRADGQTQTRRMALVK